jgi:hypothetical protein
VCPKNFGGGWSVSMTQTDAVLRFTECTVSSRFFWWDQINWKAVQLFVCFCVDGMSVVAEPFLHVRFSAGAGKVRQIQIHRDASLMYVCNVCIKNEP